MELVRECVVPPSDAETRAKLGEVMFPAKSASAALVGCSCSLAAALAAATAAAASPVRDLRTSSGANNATVAMSCCAANCSYEECLSRRYPVYMGLIDGTNELTVDQTYTCSSSLPHTMNSAPGEKDARICELLFL